MKLERRLKSLRKMKIDFFLKVFYFVFILFFGFSFVFCLSVQVDIDEKSFVEKQDKNSYLLEVYGNLSIFNPSLNDFIYEFDFPLKLDSLVGLDKVNVDFFEEEVVFFNQTNFFNCSSCFLKDNLSFDFFNCFLCFNESNQSFFNCFNCSVFDNFSSLDVGCNKCFKSEVFLKNLSLDVKRSDFDKFDFNFDRIKGYLILPNQTIKIGYRIYGMLDYNVYEFLEFENQSVLDFYIKDYNFVSNIDFSLNKPQREGFVYNMDSSINSSPVNKSLRLVSTNINNPTDFDLFFNNLKLYKTNVSSPFFDKNDFLKEFDNFSIDSKKEVKFDFFDSLSSDLDVYWVSLDFFVLSNLSFCSLQNFKDVSNLDVESSSSTGGSGFSSWSQFHNKSAIFLKKTVNKSVVQGLEELRVDLNIVYGKGVNLKDLVLVDIIPKGYVLKESNFKLKLKEEKVFFDIDSLKSFSNLNISYVLVAPKNVLGVTYFKPAKLFVEDKVYYSLGSFVVNQILPYKKVFVQKQISFYDEDFVKVNILVKNLGNYDLENLLIYESISDESIVKDISKMFFDKRGFWKIKKLESGGLWEVSYLIRSDSNFESLPNLFGLKKDEVFSTLIFSEKILTSFQTDSYFFEKIGLGFACFFVVLYILF